MKASILSVTPSDPRKPDGARVVAVAPGCGVRSFAFDEVLPQTQTQKAVYEALPRRLVMEVLNGKNASLLAYGQTGSGKTYSMFGPTPPVVAAPAPSPGAGVEQQIL